MKESIGYITEISNNGHYQLKLRSTDNGTIMAGQYFLTELQHPLEKQPHKREIFIASPINQNEILLFGQFNDNILPGGTLRLFGPLGKGFQKPIRNKLLCLSLGKYLSILISAAKSNPNPFQKIVLITNKPTDTTFISEDVEIRTIEDLGVMIEWCDEILIEINANDVERLSPFQRMIGNRKVQILVDVPMPCHAASNCGICGLKIWGKHYSICQDGPVIVVI